MTYTLSYYDETFAAGATADPLPAAHRILYVHSGAATINGQDVSAENAVYAGGAVTTTAGPDGARILRWDLAPTETPAAPSSGDGVATRLRMAQEIWSLDIPQGSQWLFRLDMIDNPAGVVADVHTHPGPGIRALLYGTFHVRQPSEDGAATEPGDPWWESGVEAVISTPSETEDSGFLRCMVLPTEYRGRPDTANWLRRPLRIHSTWKLYVDEIVTL